MSAKLQLFSQISKHPTFLYSFFIELYSFLLGIYQLKVITNDRFGLKTVADCKVETSIRETASCK